MTDPTTAFNLEAWINAQRAQRDLSLVRHVSWAEHIRICRELANAKPFLPKDRPRRKGQS